MPQMVQRSKKFCCVAACDLETNGGPRARSAHPIGADLEIGVAPAPGSDRRTLPWRDPCRRSRPSNLKSGGCDRHGASKRGDGDESTAIDVHDPAPIANSEQTVQVPGQERRARWHRSDGWCQQCERLTPPLSRVGNAARVSAAPAYRYRRCCSLSKIGRFPNHTNRRYKFL
jgi:hypothetical protein